MAPVVEIISSAKNSVIRSFVRLHRQRTRRENGQILIEGPTVFAAALAAGAHPSTVLALEEDVTTQQLVAALPDATLHIVAEHVLKTASDTTHPQSPVAIFTRPESSPLSQKNVVVLVDVSDPGNVGTIIRTAAALDWDVAVSKHTADPWSPKVLRAGAGTHFVVGIVEMEDLGTTFDNLPHVLVGTVVAGGSGSVDVEGPIALVIGSEAHGLPDEVLDSLDHQLTIPMPGGTESLNAAVAAALGMWISMGNGTDAV
jgi:TrmH family RNA methyltransferase